MKKSLRSWLWRVPVDQEITDEIALHLELRTRDLIQGGMDPKSARELALQRMGDVAIVKETCVNLGRKRDRGMRVSQWFEELRDDVKFAFRQLRAAPVFTAIAVTDARARHRRQQRDLRAGRRDAPAAAALRQPGSAGHDLGDLRREPEKLRIPAEHARLERAQPDVREDRRLYPERRRHGDGRPRRQRRNGVAPMGDGRHLRRARRRADCRPHVPSRGRREAPPRRRDERVAVGVALQSRSRDRRAGHQAGRAAVYGRRRRAEDLRDPRPHEPLGDASVRQHAAARPRAVHAAGGRPDEAGGRHRRRAVRSVGGGRRPRP